MGVPLIDRYTRAVLLFMEDVDRTSNKTLQELVRASLIQLDSIDSKAIHSTPHVRTDLFGRPPHNVPVTDFFGSVAQVQLT